jgi:predicted Zn finger-like uncharacterized protein
MRLVCPNCEAKYEVPDDAIPDTGRDVQCTNCGHSWFQMRGRVAAAPAVAPAPEVAEPTPEPAPVPEPAAQPEAAALPAEPVADAAPAETSPTDAVETPASEEMTAPAEAESAPEASGPAVQSAAEPTAEVETAEDAAAATEGLISAATEGQEGTSVAADAAEPDNEHAHEPQEAVEVTAEAEDAGRDPEPASETMAEAVGEVVEAAAAPAAAAYAVDETVLAILREEAEREANARRAETLESQTDLGIDAAVPAKGSVVAEADMKPATRRDLLPDVEEINSTLRPSEVQAEAEGAPDFVAPPPEAPRGFRSGFLTLMTIAILAAALYLVAPRLAVMVPALAGPLETYVSLIDSMRLGLDGIMRSATVAINGN